MRCVNHYPNVYSMLTIAILFSLFIICVTWFYIYPNKGDIYTDKHNNKVRVLSTNKFTIVYEHINENYESYTNPINVVFIKFIFKYRLWKRCC